MLPLAELTVSSVVLANMTLQSIRLPLTMDISGTETVETSSTPEQEESSLTKNMQDN
jgi:hypothetical protein